MVRNFFSAVFYFITLGLLATWIAIAFADVVSIPPIFQSSVNLILILSMWIFGRFRLFSHAPLLSVESDSSRNGTSHTLDNHPANHPCFGCFLDFCCLVSSFKKSILSLPMENLPFLLPRFILSRSVLSPFF